MICLCVCLVSNRSSDLLWTNSAEIWFVRQMLCVPCAVSGIPWLFVCCIENITSAIHCSFLILRTWSSYPQAMKIELLMCVSFYYRYTPEQMFNVVAAVDLYHGFVPWCQRSEVLKEYPDGSFDAELEIGFKFLVESYISHVESERPKWIKVKTCFCFCFHLSFLLNLSEWWICDMIRICIFQTTARDTGLFDHLINLWQFKPGPIPGTCDLHFHVDFKFNSPLYRQVKKLLCKTSAPKSQTV